VKKIRIVSPAKSIEGNLIDSARNLLESQGFEMSIGEHAKGEHHYFSGSDNDRLFDMQAALDEDVDVILCARGGYGAVRIVDRLDWSKFLKRPKLVAGYSDVTVFHNRMNRMGYSSIHCTAPLNFQQNSRAALASLQTILNGGKNSYEIVGHEFNRPGEVEAEIVGGNLAIISTLCGTDDELMTKGKILFIEDIGEAVYAIDRMMWQLQKAGKLHHLKGLIIGGMTAMKDSAVPFGKSVEALIRESVEQYEFPVCFNFPAGHIDDNRAILFGAKARLSVREENSTFSQIFEGI
jgi:muramoyltetrapeptide carboxypeptidase